MKTEIYSGKTLRPANLSNEYNRMLFLIFPFPQMCGKQMNKNERSFVPRSRVMRLFISMEEYEIDEMR